jgi:hypothetical protein
MVPSYVAVTLNMTDTADGFPFPPLLSLSIFICTINMLCSQHPRTFTGMLVAMNIKYKLEVRSPFNCLGIDLADSTCETALTD